MRSPVERMWEQRQNPPNKCTTTVVRKKKLTYDKHTKNRRVGHHMGMGFEWFRNPNVIYSGGEVRNETGLPHRIGLAHPTPSRPTINSYPTLAHRHHHRYSIALSHNQCNSVIRSHFVGLLHPCQFPIKVFSMLRTEFRDVRSLIELHVMSCCYPLSGERAFCTTLGPGAG